MSADLNFSEDTSDPGHPPQTEQAWGLTHAMAALVRRRDEDDWGNRLPLAWELRSITPHAYAKDADALRSYGLLRAFAAQRRKDESLPACLWREFIDDNGQPPAVDRARWDKGGLKFIFTNDLSGKISTPSDMVGAVRRLLPRWRTQFLAAVQDGRCVVSPDQALPDFNRLKVERLIHDPQKPDRDPHRGSLRQHALATGPVLGVFRPGDPRPAPDELYALHPKKSYARITTAAERAPRSVRPNGTSS